MIPSQTSGLSSTLPGVRRRTSHPGSGRVCKVPGRAGFRSPPRRGDKPSPRNGSRTPPGVGVAQKDGRLLGWGGVTWASPLLIPNTFIVPLPQKVSEGALFLITVYSRPRRMPPACSCLSACGPCSYYQPSCRTGSSPSQCRSRKPTRARVGVPLPQRMHEHKHPFKTGVGLSPSDRRHDEPPGNEGMGSAPVLLPAPPPSPILHPPSLHTCWAQLLPELLGRLPERGGGSWCP